MVQIKELSCNFINNMNYSEQQLSIINSEGDLVVNAIAGSGKTSTLLGFAEKRSKERMLYLAFNKSVKDEAITMFDHKGLSKVQVETAHSLAFKNQRGHLLKINKGNYQAYDVKQILGLKLKDAVEDMRYGRHVIQLVNAFCNSAVTTVSEMDYLSLQSGEDKNFVANHMDQLTTDARRFLGKMKNGEIEITHDFYLKMYQLSNPDLSGYDYILFDEGQDASPVMLDVFMKQNATKVIVGDEHQQIYGWRHAVNALKSSEYKRLFLNTSYRFDDHIGKLAKSILGTKQMLEDLSIPNIRGAGLTSDISSKATLGRTNSAILVDAIENLVDYELIDKVYFEGNFNTYTYADESGSVYDVLNLYLGNWSYIKNPMIKGFQDFVQLEEYVEKTNDASLSGIINIVKQYKRDLPSIIKTIKEKHVEHDQKNEADMIYSTVHKAKGMEYGEVTLLEDFLGEQKLKELISRNEIELDMDRVLEDINILYVAVTRAKNKLIIPESLVPAEYNHDHKCNSIEIIPSERNDFEFEDNEFYDFSLDSFEAEITELEKSYSVSEVRKKHQHAYKGWTDEDDQALKKLFAEGKKVKELAEHFGRTRGAIRSRLKKLEVYY